MASHPLRHAHRPSFCLACHFPASDSLPLSTPLSARSHPTMLTGAWVCIAADALARPVCECTWLHSQLAQIPASTPLSAPRCKAVCASSAHQVPLAMGRGVPSASGHVWLTHSDVECGVHVDAVHVALVCTRDAAHVKSGVADDGDVGRR